MTPRDSLTGEKKGKKKKGGAYLIIPQKASNGRWAALVYLQAKETKSAKLTWLVETAEAAWMRPFRSIGSKRPHQ